MRARGDLSHGARQWLHYDGSVDFVLENTVVGRAPLVPEIELHLAHEVTELWTATESWLAARAVEPPFWAFAWAGGQAVARHLLDHPTLVRGKTVVDVASGGGIVAIAAALAGAARVIAVDPDALAAVARAHNARLNGVIVETRTMRAEDFTDAVEVVTAGDVFYDAKMTAALLPWLRERASSALVLMGDPGRAYRPEGLTRVASYRTPVEQALEGKLQLDGTVYSFGEPSLKPLPVNVPVPVPVPDRRR